MAVEKLTVMGSDMHDVIEVANFGRLIISHEDLEDLSTFSGMSEDECLRRLQTYSIKEMADLWRATHPQSPDEIVRFYQTAEAYIWELMAWNASASRQRHWNALERVAKEFPANAGFARVLDFGCGVGGDSLFLARRGYRVTLMDVDGPAFRFAQHRFARRGLEGRFITSSSSVPQPESIYDVIICFDVFEHLPDPVAAARSLVKSLRRGGLLVQVATFFDNGEFPHHMPSNIVRFHGWRWHIWLSGLGLRSIDETRYQKLLGWRAWLRRARFNLWRFTGLWLIWINPLGNG
jgi:SAM-dependent methyltransferase